MNVSVLRPEVSKVAVKVALQGVAAEGFKYDAHLVDLVRRNTTMRGRQVQFGLDALRRTTRWAQVATGMSTIFEEGVSSQDARDRFEAIRERPNYYFMVTNYLGRQATKKGTTAPNEKLLTAEQACTILGLKWGMWKKRMWRFHKGEPNTYKKDDRRRFTGWMPTPVEGAYLSKKALFTAADIARVQRLHGGKDPTVEVKVTPENDVEPAPKAWPRAARGGR
jgi:hypothetical protein